jgi:hypothetical protein
VSVSAVLYPRWPPLLKLEISSNGQNCSILSHKVPKFELYKHNDKLINIYYGIFYAVKVQFIKNPVIYVRKLIIMLIQWLKIEQFWRFEEISMFINGGHLG